MYWSVNVDGVAYVGGYGSELTLQCMWVAPMDFSIAVLRKKGLLDNTW